MLHWQGGGCVCKRQDLPAELAARYPYEPEKAAQWAREKAAQNAEIQRRSAEQQRARVLDELRRREARLKAQMQSAKNELQTLNQIIPVLAEKAKGTRRRSPQHAKADSARDRKIELLSQIHELQEELSAT
jgi:predicted RNase H-like nuclease (RuvC/YqgF family)